MGRPLKIAKAQAILTLTDTNAGSDYVTVSQNLSQPTVANPEYAGVIAGMPFVPASSIGGLVGGTTYWVLRVLSTTTFTVSATPLDANPTLTPVNLSAAGPVTVSLTVGVVDSGFNNPTGSANTYSVVGGNTGIYGPQVLAQVAIGINGTGTLYSATNTAYVTGIGTDLANTLSVGSAIQVASANINGSTDYTTIGFANTVGGFTAIAVANTNNTGNIIRTTGNAQTLFANGTVRFTANLGGLVSGQVYFVKAIANATAFNVSSTLAGAEVDLSDATGTPDAQQDVVELVANAAVASTGAAFVYANDEAGFIVRQKGKQKYLVTGSTSGLTSQCLLANVANTALTPNTMRILATYANSATQTVQSLSDHTGELFTATSGPIATGNIVFGNATPIFATFNTAIAANAANAQPYPIVTIANA
jgi:hypothetical protein